MKKDMPVMVCIDTYENGVPKGRIYPFGNKEFEQGSCFQGTIGFLKCMEYFMRQYGQFEYEDHRSFRTMPDIDLQQPSQRTPENSGVATFIIRVLYRQHGSWQGEIRWCEGKLEERFRSVLELLLLMDSAMTEGKQERLSHCASMRYDT